jgi:outer membrane protein OmpA-like peptidoglycan-associated protein
VPTTSVAFGNRTVSGSPHQLTFTIQNTSSGAGSETMDYTMALTGTGAAAYSLSPACATTCTLTAGSTQTVTVNFSPSARISYAGLVTINADDPDEQGVNAPTVTLSGTGIAPVIGNISPASQTLAFGLIDVGANSGNLTASIQNTGDSPLNISAVTLTGTNPGQFTIMSGTTGSHQIATNGSDSWQVRCNPTSTGDKTANLHIASDALGAATFDFALTCTGQQAIFGFSPAAGLDFGSIFVGQVGGPTAVTITNNGNKSGTVSSIVSGNGAFTFTTVGGPTLAPAGSMTVNVTFTPVNGNNITTQLTVNTDGSPASFPIPLHGDGKTEGQNVTIAGETDLSVTLGNIRVGNTVTKVVTVQNEGDTAFNLAIPSSTSGECVVQAVSPALPATIAGGGIATFNINVTPADLGASTCTITVQSVTQGGGATNTDTIDVSFSGVAPDVTVVAPADFSLEFNGVDVDSAPVMQVVQVQNSGDFPLTISGCSVSPPGRFAVVTNCGTPFSVAIGDTTSIQVSYDPSVEALDAANLVLNVDAFSGPTVQIALSGVGVDQNITLPALHYDFPDTYRNPDPDQTPTVNVVVQNPANATTGFGADLHVSMTMINQTTEGVYVVSDTAALTVAPDATGEIPVEFHPTAAPALFEGTLVITNDDTGQGMAEVTLSGNGISRNVAVTPNNFDLMTTGVGVPVHLSDLTEGGIVVQNMATDDFTVRELRFVDSSGQPIDSDAFVILDGDSPRDLAAGAHEDFDIEFAPLESGEYEILVAIYLDGDPLAQSQVQLRGRAVDVELHGGGGCAAGGGGGGWGALVLGAAAVLGLRRRRLAAVALALGLVLVAAPAFADPTRNIDITTFAPAPATEVDGFQVESPVIGVNGAWALDLTVNHATNPLTATSSEIDGMTDRPVSARTGLQLAFAYAFLDEFEAGVRVPFYSSSGEDPQFSGLQPANGSTLGDIAAHVKARLFASGGLAGAASLDVTVPTAKDDQYAGVSGPAAQIRVLGGWRNPRMGATANVGFVARGAGDLADITQGNAVTFGAGGSYRALESLWVIGEAFGASGMGSKGPGVKQLEGVLGVRYQVGRTVGISVGGGRGILTGIGSPDIRAFAMVDVSPRARPEKPLFVRKPPPPRDTRDDDGDRIVNADDTCKSDAEDEDGFKDDDGCPELDNDEDGALDADDKCPIEAEDKDGFQDEDGCIDADNDGDKVPDVDDKCPMEVEDFDGYNDNDGCDEPDNDSDGIPDVIDQCALEQETINGKNDDDGCPDNGDSAVMVMPDRIEIFEPVLFDGTSAKLSKKSANVLGQVAATLRANRDFKRIRVTVHVHPRNDDDDSLSTKRAKAVEAWLVKWGIEPERLDAKGMGSSRPLVKKDKKGAAALNDRVEFIILEKDVGQ